MGQFGDLPTFNEMRSAVAPYSLAHQMFVGSGDNGYSAAGSPGGAGGGGAASMSPYISMAQGSGYNAIKGNATSPGASPWASMATNRQNLAAQDQQEHGAVQVAGQTAKANDDLAARGGLSSGARERVAQSGATNAMDMSQGVNRQKNLNNMDIGLEDQKMKMGQQNTLAGLDQADMAGKNAYNENQYNQQMAAWGAGKQADATAASGKGGGMCCFIFLEARYGNGTMDKVVRRFRNERMTAKNSRGYYKLSEVLVPMMRKSKIVKFAVRAFMTDPLVAYGRAYYGGSKVGLIFKPIANFWLKTFEYLGEDHPFIRENGEIV